VPELQRLCEQVDVPGEDVEREGLRVDAVGAALAALVDVEDAEVVGKRIEIGPELRVIHAGPAVEHDQREPVPELLDRHAVAVAQRDEHARSLCASLVRGRGG
jgi:hypothetical protein